MTFDVSDDDWLAIATLRLYNTDTTLGVFCDGRQVILIVAARITRQIPVMDVSSRPC